MGCAASTRSKRSDPISPSEPTKAPEKKPEPETTKSEKQKEQESLFSVVVHGSLNEAEIKDLKAKFDKLVDAGGHVTKEKVHNLLAETFGPSLNEAFVREWVKKHDEALNADAVPWEEVQKTVTQLFVASELRKQKELVAQKVEEQKAERRRQRDSSAVLVPQNQNTGKQEQQTSAN